MEDQELGAKLTLLNKEIETHDRYLNSIKTRLAEAKDQTQLRQAELERAKAQAQLEAKRIERDDLIRINRADRNYPGRFYVVAPPFTGRRASTHRPEWTVLGPDFRENLTNRYVKPTDPILRLGDVAGPSEVELKIPEKHIGQVRRAFDRTKPDPTLDVDLLLTSAPTKTFRGVLHLSRLAGEAIPNRDAHDESAPVVIGYVSLDDESIPEDMRVPHSEFVTGVEVHAKIRCGNERMGYSLFYGLWEFIYEKVVFFF
jgi:hypothetical protein